MSLAGGSRGSEEGYVLDNWALQVMVTMAWAEGKGADSGHARQAMVGAGLNPKSKTDTYNNSIC